MDQKGYVICNLEDLPLKAQEVLGRTKLRGIKEHRAIMSMMLGRPLLDHEVVHHKNGVKHDNRPENLEVLTSEQHAAIIPKLRQRIADLEARIADLEAIHHVHPSLLVT